MKSELCESCVHTNVCGKDKNIVGDVFVMGHPSFFDNDELFRKFKEREAAGFPCDDYMQERKRGKWMTTDAFPHHVYCSACHRTYIPNDNWQVWRDQYGDGGLPRDFCPNCGADMRGEDE